MNQERQHAEGIWLALPSTELQAWEERTGNIVRREERDILRRMERAYLDAVNARGQDGGPIRSGSGEISAAAFDAVFG